MILTSTGMHSWDILTCLASKRGFRVKMFLRRRVDQSESSLIEYYSREYNLDKTTTEWSFIDTSPGREGNLLFQAGRDKGIVKMADIIFPVSIRPDGNLQDILTWAANEGKDIRQEYMVEWNPRKFNLNDSYSTVNIDRNIDELLQYYIIHWTRTTHLPWPGESAFNYCDAIVSSKDNYARSALATLGRIWDEKKLRASSRHMRKGIRAVSLSSLMPSQAVKLMRWRARYREMTFEPYGVAIKKSAAKKANIRKVIYGNPEMIRYLPPDEQPYFQSLGAIGDWRQEKEYRHIGDLSLAQIDDSDMALIVWCNKDVKSIKRHFDGDIYSMINKDCE